MELSPILHFLFCQCYQTATIPTFWQTATVIPVPNKSRPAELNHYRVIALTSIIMKCLEKLLLHIIFPVVTPHLDPLQFAYRTRRGTKDAVACLLHLLLQHLDFLGNFARILFVDFSSAFNSLQKHLLIQKLHHLNIPPQLIHLTHNFLTNRLQAVVIHTLQYFTTASSQVPNFPEYVEVGYVDEVEMSYYDSNIRKTESKQDWMNKITAEDPNYWQIETEINVVKEHVLKDNIEILKKRFNQTGGVHTYQVMSGCEWNDETDEVKGWLQISYDEDFISLDMKTWTWTAAKQQAFPTKLKWDQEISRLDYYKYYYTELCPSYLKKYVEYGKKVLMRTELPEVFLLQKTPSSPVSCMATGFYPDRADLFWRKDGEQILEDVEHGELLPNHDGTFQLSVELKVEVTAKVEGKYECVFQLSGVKEDLVTKLERKSILSNASHEGVKQINHTIPTGNVSVTATLAVLAVVVLLAAPIIIIIFTIKRRRSRQAQYDPAAGDGGNELSERRAG
ncbi:major histocompatibility complex class I-related gene protein-like [Nerophis ophidion]|uniref:major histocompatibility complex class I-related gene protein-like n=1 Tax=Nerophis ophidion TaxID=159077 RepID=UPI002AE07802|nr:major histocompatibility complex class I-related gene protein-like [Nerophis ophidion]